MSNNEKPSGWTRLKGGVKILLGWLALFYPNSLSLASYAIVASLLSGIAVGGAKLISAFSSDPERKSYWDNKAKEAISFGTKSLVRAASLLIPFVGAGALIAEGGQHVITGKKSFFNTIQDNVAQYTSGLSSNDPKHLAPVVAQPPQSHTSPAQNANQQQIPPSQSSINMAAVTGAENFEKATQNYKAEINKSSSGKYEMTSFEPDGAGGYKAVYIPPGYTKDNCPEGLKVEQIFDKNMQVIEVKPGAQATCVTPPIKTQTGFDVRRYENGAPIDCKAAAQNAQTMRSNGLGNASHSSPPINVKEKEQNLTH